MRGGRHMALERLGPEQLGISLLQRWFTIDSDGILLERAKAFAEKLTLVPRLSTKLDVTP